MEEVGPERQSSEGRPIIFIVSRRARVREIEDQVHVAVLDLLVDEPRHAVLDERAELGDGLAREERVEHPAERDVVRAVDLADPQWRRPSERGMPISP